LEKTLLPLDRRDQLFTGRIGEVIGIPVGRVVRKMLLSKIDSRMQKAQQRKNEAKLWKDR